MSKTNEVKVEEVVVATKVEADPVRWAALVEEHKSISGAIRALAAGGMSKGDIARLSGKRYQHVRNVLITPLKKA
jgi:hypothetical protein